MSDKTVIRAEHLEKHFREGKLDTHVLKSVTLSVAPGESLAIVGSSGAGKSTLLHLLGGLDMPSKGEVWIMDQALSTLSTDQRCTMRNKHLGFIYQFHHLLPEFTALENVAMPLLIRQDSVIDAKLAAMAILEKVGLAHRLHHKPSALSGGERQRTAFARALVTKPQCVLADEPTGNLDSQSASALHELMQSLNDELGISFVIVTHDLNLAKHMQRMIEIADGQIIASH